MALQGLNMAPCNRISLGALVSFSSSLFSPYHSSRKKEIPVSQLFRGTLPSRGTKPLFSPCRVSSSPKLISEQDFADTEAARFREGLSRMLQAKDELGEIRTQMVDTCTKIFREFAMTCRGDLPAEPFAELRKALEEQGIPMSEVSNLSAASKSRNPSSGTFFEPKLQSI